MRASIIKYHVKCNACVYEPANIYRGQLQLDDIFPSHEDKLAHGRSRGVFHSAITEAPGYFQLQNEWPFFNMLSSFFRGNSPFFLRFQQKKSGKVGIYIAIRSKYMRTRILHFTVI